MDRGREPALAKDKVRFAVGGPGVGYSSTWSAWHEADIMARALDNADRLHAIMRHAPADSETLRLTEVGNMEVRNGSMMAALKHFTRLIST